MVAFEILVNGEHLYTIGAGEFGILTAMVHWHRLRTMTAIHERVVVNGTAMHHSDKTHSGWPDKELEVGDEVTVRIIESHECDPAASRRTRGEPERKA